MTGHSFVKKNKKCYYLARRRRKRMCAFIVQWLSAIRYSTVVVGKVSSNVGKY